MLAALALQVPIELQELRAVWLSAKEVRALATSADIGQAIDFLAEAGANVVVVDAWNDAAGAPALLGDQWDRYETLVFHAHRRGLEILAGFDPSIACATDKDCPVLQKHPAWGARKRSGETARWNGAIGWNVLDADVQALASKVVLEACRAHEFDGVVFGPRLAAPMRLAGYEPETVSRWRKEFGKDLPRDESDAAFVRWRAEIVADFLLRMRKDLKAVDASLVFAVAPRTGAESAKDWVDTVPLLLDRGACDALLPQADAADIVAAPWAKENVAKIGIFPTLDLDRPEWRKDPADVARALEHDRELGLRGEVFLGLAPLREHDGAIVAALRDKPWLEYAHVPWRGGRAWRAPVAPVDAIAGAGNWNWRTREGEPTVLEIDGGEAGHVVWTLVPPETANYDLYVWISPRTVVGKRAPYKIATAGGKRTLVVDPTLAKNKGWVHLGQAQLEGGKMVEAARLDADEPDFTRMTTAGPLLVIPQRRKIVR